MVDDDGRAAPDDCESRSRSYRRIQDALDDARPGDRILGLSRVAMPESLRIGPRGNDVYLATEFSFRAVLVPPATDERPAVDIQDVSRFEMRGFRIRPSGHIGRVAIGGLSIPGTRVCSPAPVAIRIRDSRDVTIRGDRVATGPTCGYRVGIDIAALARHGHHGQDHGLPGAGHRCGPRIGRDLDQVRGPVPAHGTRAGAAWLHPGCGSRRGGHRGRRTGHCSGPSRCSHVCRTMSTTCRRCCGRAS